MYVQLTCYPLPLASNRVRAGGGRQAELPPPLYAEYVVRTVCATPAALDRPPFSRRSPTRPVLQNSSSDRPQHSPTRPVLQNSPVQTGLSTRGVGSAQLAVWADTVCVYVRQKLVHSAPPFLHLPDAGYRSTRSAGSDTLTISPERQRVFIMICHWLSRTEWRMLLR